MKMDEVFESITHKQLTMKTLLSIISFLIPILGVVIYFVRKDSDEDAGTYLVCGGAGFVFNLLLLLV